MDDLISRQAALDTFGLSEKSRKYGGDHSGYDTIMLYEVQDALEALPSVQPEQGRWDAKWNTLFKAYLPCCSVCSKSAVYTFDYCPNCGAKMVEDGDAE